MGPISAFDAGVIALVLGWPGLVVGVPVGAVALPRHRLTGAVCFAVIGLLACIVVRLMV
jgi:putative Mn2+ efflux pump MntP